MMGATTPLYKNKVVHGEGKDWQHDHKSKPAHPNTPEAHNVKPKITVKAKDGKEYKMAPLETSGPINKKKKKNYAIEDYKKGWEAIKLEMKNNPNMSKHDIRQLVIAHNKSVTGKKYKKGHTANAKISLNSILKGWNSGSKEEEITTSGSTTTPSNTEKKMQAFTVSSDDRISIEQQYGSGVLTGSELAARNKAYQDAAQRFAEQRNY